MPSRRARIALDRTFTPCEMEQIRMGVVPDQMEDKWFVYYEDDILYFHRSWTGYCIYMVYFEPEEEGCRMVRGEVNRELETPRVSEDEEAAMISFLIDVLLLDEVPQYPADEEPSSDEVLAMWGLLGNAFIGKRPGDE